MTAPSNASPEGQFTGKVALITGAARGQGRSHALATAREGAAVVLVDICSDVASAAMPQASRADLDATSAAIEKLGGKVTAIQADVRNFKEMQAAVETATSQYGRLDSWSANAGIVGFGRVWEIDPAAWSEMLDVTPTGAW